MFRRTMPLFIFSEASWELDTSSYERSLVLEGGTNYELFGDIGTL